MKEHYLKYLPKPLLADLVEQRWLPLVGAGMSRNAVVPRGAHLPLWDELGRAIADEIPDFPYTGAIDAISAYEHEFSRARLVEALSSHLLLGQAQPGEAHRAFCAIPFDIVCTTNLEFLLEEGYRATGRYCRPVIDEDNLSVTTRDAAVTLLKLHGDLHHPQRLVVTEEDYDRFLNAHPLLATYLANLLIIRTAVLIGYSAEDPDFRQIWQLIGDRLGRLRRPAYAIMVAPRPTEIARFDRRGVKVVALPGTAVRYGEILADLFRELRIYQEEKLVQASQVTEEAPMAELRLPKEAANRLCFLAVPVAGLPFYKDRVFEIVRQRGFVPVTADDVLAPGDSIAAKMEALIERARLVIVDASRPSTRYELSVAYRSLGAERVLVILQEDLVPPPEIPDAAIIRRPTMPVRDPDVFLKKVDAWLSKMAKMLAPRFADEPDRLLQSREYRAAVISAFTLLEATLRDRLLSGDASERHPTGLGSFIEPAQRSGIVTSAEARQMREWLRVRNMAVHSQQGVPAKDAREIVTGILRLVMRIKGA
jgi:hypothetical protein